jgi:hypothetical protein
MFRKQFIHGEIPCTLWGKEKSSRVIIAVHGYFANKEDACIAILAEESVSAGYQVLSFDLPAHGDRSHIESECHVEQAVKDIRTIITEARKYFSQIELFACSIGASFSLLACENELIKKIYFLSPIVDLEALTLNMMADAGITEATLKCQQFIKVPSGPCFRHDYLAYLQQHRILDWSLPTHILMGGDDNIACTQTVMEFSRKYQATIDIIDGAPHYLNRQEDREVFRYWLRSWFNLSDSSAM